MTRRIPLVIPITQRVRTAPDGRKYILNPITGERIYQWHPPMAEIPPEPVTGNLKPIEGLFQKIKKDKV